MDFVLCDPTTLGVFAVVELDDASHNTNRQRERDQWKESALRVASSPLIRIPAARSYSTADLAERIDPQQVPANSAARA